MKPLVALFMTISFYHSSMAQDNIVSIMDRLRGDWDAKVQFLQSYDDMVNLCRNHDFRTDLIKLLDDIHHYDTTLYQVVTAKYSDSSDAEAKATLDDIEKLERDYTTFEFREFVHKECGEFNVTESNFGKEGAEYESEKKRIETELVKYLKAITYQIDVIDEHAHHLKL